MFAIKSILVMIIFYVLHHEHIVEATCSCSETEVSEGEREVVGTVHEQGRKLSYSFWSKDPSTNVVLSPLSISIMLNLLMLATDGNTKLEIKQVINYSNELQERKIHEIYKSIFSCLQVSENGVEISLLSRIFVQEGFTILDSYLSISESSYMSELEKIDFLGYPEQAKDTINKWVSDSTKGKIGEIFFEPLRPNTASVLVNVIFFNATWQNQFRSYSTKNGTFEADSGNITIPMMSCEMVIPYMRNENKALEMISLPYEGNCFSMIVLKPIDNSGTSLQQLENILKTDELNTLISQMQDQKVDVTIPRMKIELELDLKQDLQSFGINDIFNKGANFSRLTHDNRLFISEIKHKAILEVTEAGTIASAVTAAVVVVKSVEIPSPPKFMLNRPSLIFIRDNHNGLILFWAKVMAPEPFLD